MHDCMVHGVYALFVFYFVSCMVHVLQGVVHMHDCINCLFLCLVCFFVL